MSENKVISLCEYRKAKGVVVPITQAAQNDRNLVTSIITRFKNDLQRILFEAKPEECVILNSKKDPDIQKVSDSALSLLKGIEQLLTHRKFWQGPNGQK